MKFGSVCSGIEAASVAWHPLGWRAAWFSEIEPFPSAVLAHHYPDVQNLGDMTSLPDRIRSGEVEAPDVFCGGTPCQAFSVAGQRKSLDDARGNLSLTFCEIANAIDDIRRARGEQPTIVFWENVPGVLSTKDNAFGCFLAELAGESCELEPPGGKWTNAGCVFGPTRAVAWRVTDAQYFGVAQRRKRVFVIASARDGFDPTKVLFEFEGVRRDIAPSRETGERIAPCVTNGPPFSRTGNERVEAEAMVVMSSGQANAEIRTDGGKPALTCLHEAPIVAHPSYGIQSTIIGRKPENGPQGSGLSEEISYTLTKTDQHGVAHPMVLMDQGGGVMNVNTDGTVGTLRRETHWNEPLVMQTVAAFKGGQGSGAGGIGYSEHVAPTLPSNAGGNTAPTLLNGMAVRRLTPVECERLQGFPDNYTNIPWRKQPESPDGPRYKALGNSWAVPNVRWIGKRIAEYLLQNSNDNELQKQEHVA